MANFEMFSPPEANPTVFGRNGEYASLALVTGSMYSVQIALRNNSASTLDVDVDVAGGAVVRVEPALVSPGDRALRVFQVTGRKAGSAIVEARIPNSNQIMASLAIVVREPAPAPPIRRAVTGDLLTNFEIGFIEGLATVHGSRNLNLLITAIKSRPGQFYAGYIDGTMSGLWAGLKDLFEGLVALGALAPYAAALAVPGLGQAVIAMKLMDPEFRRKAAEQLSWARAVGEAAKGVVEEFAKDPAGSVDKYLGASTDAGHKIGEAFAAEIDRRAALGGPIEYGQWIGWAVGRIGFEVILILVTEGIGEAVKGASVGGQGLKGLRATGEAAELFARVRVKIQEVLDSLPALKNFVETVTKSKSGKVVEIIETQAAKEARISAEVDRAFSEEAILQGRLQAGSVGSFPILKELPTLSAEVQAKAAKLLGQEFSPELKTVWKNCSNAQADKEMAEVQRLLKTGSAADREAAYKLSESVYSNWRDRFWRKVRGDSSLRKIFEDAGARFEGRSGAPYYKIGDTKTKNLQVTLDHFVERRVDNPARAVDELNVRPVLSFENSATLEAIRRDNFLKGWFTPLNRAR